jgi:dipeptidyl aminopeptidase/acylaminoacyl peptidase
MTMDRSSRADRVLIGLIDELADARTPDYLEAAIERASSRPQRPAWTLPERWFPMAETVSRPAFAPRVPWRAIGVALVILALLIAAAVFVGSRQHRLPPTFGPARNGLIAYAMDGDIYTADPATGVATAIVTGPETDIDPEFSLDGTKLLFARERGSANAYDILVANADGSGTRVVTTDPLTTDDRAHLTPDGSAVIVTRQGKIQRIDVRGGGATTDIAIGRWADDTIRATDGAILFENDATPAIDLWVMKADGSDQRLLWDPHLDSNAADLSEYKWSPDGTRIAYICSDPATHVGSNVCVMNADGSDPHQLTHEGTDWWEDGLQWSPDGLSLAFVRHQQAPGATSYVNRPIGIVPVSGGPIIELGPTPQVDTDFAWSPDGKTLLTLPSLQSSHLGASAVKPTEIDVATGDVHEMPFDVASSPSWQRAPLD